MPQDSRPIAEKRDTDSARLLVVDDDRELLDRLCLELSENRYLVTGCGDGTEALRTLQHDEFEVLLTDLVMPGLDGLQLLKEARELDPHLVTVVMTSNASVETAVAVMKHGGFDYVPKPVDLGILIPILTRALEMRRLRRENLQMRESVALHEFTEALAFTLDVDSLLDKVASAALQQCEADEVSIMLMDREGNELSIALVRGSKRDHLRGKRLPVDRGIAGYVARTSETLTLAGPVADPRFTDVQPRAEIASSAVLPMQAAGKLMGVLNVNALRARHSITPGQVKALAVLANTAASALQVALLHTQLREDIAAREQAEHELLESNQQLSRALEELRALQEETMRQERLRAIGRMASGIAHDFNNSLAPIVGFTELLLANPAQLDDRERLLRYLEAIHTASMDAARIVSRLREFYRRREETDVFVPVRINQLIDQVIELTQPKWKHEAQAAGVVIEITSELHGAPLVPGVESELREALTNLIFNAVDAMPQGGTLTLRAALDEGQVVVEVSDTGIGMTEEVRQRCLEPFFSTKGDRGTGMGLGMVHGIVQRHDGSIQVESEVGLGTTFILRLPQLKESEATEVAIPLAPPMRKLHVLLVEDDLLTRTMLMEYLITDGHTVVTATKGTEGLEAFRAQPQQFDLVVTDRAMPGLGGDQLALAIHELAPELPIIMVTGFGDLMRSMGEQPPGVALVVPKPVTPTGLRHAIARVVK